MIDFSTSDITNAKILLVDDDNLNTEVLAQSLNQFKNVHAVSSGIAAIEFCKQTPPDLVLLDVMMPELDGHETCRILRTLSGMQDCPIIFSTSLGGVQDEINCWESGGTDYVSKPVSPLSLIKRVQSHIRLKLQSDAQKALAVFDSLTGLRNRRFFDDYYAQQINLSRRTKSDLSIVVIDIDYFKHYNDFYGHVQGDFCLQLVAKILSDKLNRPTDIAVRYGGEEFALILPSTDIEGARFVTNQIIAQFEQQAIPHEKSPLGKVTVSAGVASLSTIEQGEDLFSVADKRMYSIKNSGRNAWA